MDISKLKDMVEEINNALGKYYTWPEPRSQMLTAAGALGLMTIAGEISGSLSRIADALERIAESEAGGAKLSAAILAEYEKDAECREIYENFNDKGEKEGQS